LYSDIHRKTGILPSGRILCKKEWILPSWGGEKINSLSFTQ